MRQSNTGFLKTTVIGGLVVIVPIAILALLLGDLFNALVAVAEPVSKYLPFGAIANTVIVTLLALFAILLLCFVTGLFVRTSWGHAGKDWFERKLLNRLPMYGMIRDLTHKFTGSEEMQFTPAEIDLYNSESTVLGAIVEELPDGRLAVFVPVTPLATVGQVHLVPAERVKRLDVSLAAAVSSVTDWGTGVSGLFKQVGDTSGAST